MLCRTASHPSSDVMPDPRTTFRVPRSLQPLKRDIRSGAASQHGIQFEKFPIRRVQGDTNRSHTRRNLAGPHSDEREETPQLNLGSPVETWQIAREIGHSCLMNRP